jgi:hypothetical protein
LGAHILHAQSLGEVPPRVIARYNCCFASTWRGRDPSAGSGETEASICIDCQYLYID